MIKLRNNFFYSLSILGFIAWIVNTVSVIGICGISHPILLREIFYLGLLIYIFYSYAHKIYDDVIPSPFHRRATVTEGDKIVLRFLGPWISLVLQMTLTATFVNSIHDNVVLEVKPKQACEFRSKYKT